MTFFNKQTKKNNGIQELKTYTASPGIYANINGIRYFYIV